MKFRLLSLLHLGSGRLDHRRPFRNFRFDIGGELRRRVGRDVDAEVGELVLDVRVVERLADGLIERGDDLRGVPAGATRPCQVVASKPGSPASSMVGTSGRLGVRLSVVTASARTWPFLRNPITPDVVANIIWSCPAMTSSSAGADPL